mgnify:CR=1 FL=1
METNGKKQAGQGGKPAELAKAAAAYALGALGMVLVIASCGDSDLPAAQHFAAALTLFAAGCGCFAVIRYTTLRDIFK